MLRKKKKGQSTLEYVILVTGIIVLVLAFFNSGIFDTALNATWQSAADGMTNMANRLEGSRYQEF